MLNNYQQDIITYQEATKHNSNQSWLVSTQVHENILSHPFWCKKIFISISIFEKKPAVDRLYLGLSLKG